MFCDKTSDGFTVIELLVMIAVIAVIGSIAITNVSGYGSKGKDAAIKSNIGEIAINGSIYFENNGTYNPPGSGTFCNDPVTAAIFDSIVATTKQCNTSATQWRVCARLNLPATGTARAWCADSTGGKKEINNSQCNGSSAPCP